MPEFVNEFSWSPSRHRMFETCRRQYYYNYYGSWGGWKDAAPEHVRLLYQLKKMTTLPQLVGSVVHDAVSRVLKALQTGRKIPPQTVATYAAQLFDRHIDDSEQQRWRRSASRHTNLFEHYYGELFDADAARARIRESLDAFFASEPYRHLSQVPPEQWLSVEELESFTYNATKLWVALDVAVHHNGGVDIFDWKTGRERDADKLQLAVYALYAASAWGTALPDLRLRDVYLQTGTVRTVPIDTDILETTRKTIVESVAAMRDRLDDPEANAASLDAFPMTDDLSTCASCPFKTVCRRTDAPAHDPAPQKAPVQLTLF